MCLKLLVLEENKRDIVGIELSIIKHQEKGRKMNFCAEKMRLFFHISYTLMMPMDGPISSASFRWDKRQLSCASISAYGRDNPLKLPSKWPCDRAMN